MLGLDPRAAQHYWTERHIHSIVGEFGRVQRWVADDRMRCRLLVRITVSSLDKVPQFILYDDPEKANGESWTLQCEVLQPHQVQQGPPIEDPLPENVDMEMGLPFDFFGLGQPVNGLNEQEDNLGNQQQDAWEPWPKEIPAQQQPMQLKLQDRNEVPVQDQQGHLDLNQPAPDQDINQDLHPVIFNPAVPEENGNNEAHEQG